MIFQHTWEKVLSGEKTQTRRIVKDGDVGGLEKIDLHPYAIDENPSLWLKHPFSEVYRNDRLLWQIGKTYAVSAGRGKPAIARIRLTEIWKSDVREISSEDVEAEGFQDMPEFLETWVQMHDPVIWHWFAPLLESRKRYANQWVIWDMLEEKCQQRPMEHYIAWALTFALVEQASEAARVEG